MNEIITGTTQTTHNGQSRPRLGVLDFNPIQYHVPLYKQLARRGNVILDVLYLSDRGYQPAIDPHFGVEVAWDIDLLSGYTYSFLTANRKSQHILRLISKLKRWITAQDRVVIYGYSHYWMLIAIALCRLTGTQYLLRGDSRPDGQATGFRGALRDIVARIAVSGCACCLAIGQLNAEFYRQYGARYIVFAPYSVDNERFSRRPNCDRLELATRCNLKPDLPTIMFCGKLYPGKRPLDILDAISLLKCDVNVLFVGDGILAETIQVELPPGKGIVTGFINQSELPSYYHAADILVLPSEAEKWGLVVNEAMAAGVLPVVSDRVGAGPDLVRGIGEIYPCGDVTSLAGALSKALAKIADPGIRDRVRRHAARYSLDTTAAGFEEAVLALRTAPP
jgi:glycosyltransferase involved in cell wall biosynthesis